MQLPIQSRFLKFSIIGGVGFLVDASVLYIAMSLGTGLYWGRVVSYCAAATSTWAMNRRFTFREQRGENRLVEWAKFFAANSVGGITNYAVYATLISVSPLVAQWPILGVAAGCIAGLSINFNLSRRVVFTGN